MIHKSTERGTAKNSAHFSALFLAYDFGVISPNTSTRRVITTVATPTPPLPRICVNKTVLIEVERIFTMLFPIRIAVRAFSKELAISSAFSAFLFP